MNSLFLLLAAALPLRLWPGTVPDLRVVESERREGYVCSLVEYNVSGDERVQSFLLVPDGASAETPVPGLVLLHDHGARFDIGKEKLVRPLASATEHIRRSSAQWVRDGFDGVYFADRLAALGYVVIVPDVLYWGGRSTELCRSWSRMEFTGEPGDRKAVKKAVYEGQRAVYDSLARQGIVWAEKTLNEDAAAARLLRGLPYVGDIGCFGWSMGAHRAWLLAASCPEVSTGVALCWMTLKEAQPTEYSASDYSMLIPSLRDRYDFPDIARALAPKPFLFLNGRTDKLFPEWAVRKAFDRMQEIYSEVLPPPDSDLSAAGPDLDLLSAGPDTDLPAAGPLRTLFFDGGHHCGLAEQETILDFLRETLGGPPPAPAPVSTLCPVDSAP